MELPQEHLERLQLDEALGALTPEAQTLLRAYLAEHPQPAGQADEWQQTVELARQALGQDTPVALPPLRRPRRIGAHLLRFAAVCAGLAACVALGIMLGRAYVAPSQPVTAGQVATHASPTEKVAPAADPNGFWSAQRLYRQASERSERSEQNKRPAHLVWKSPTEMPHIGEEI